MSDALFQTSLVFARVVVSFSVFELFQLPHQCTLNTSITQPPFLVARGHCLLVNNTTMDSTLGRRTDKGIAGNRGLFSLDDP